ncbi:hypothetical protein ABPG74_011325 [Tetrahymena malaccensis]
MTDLPQTYRIWECPQKGVENIELVSKPLPTDLEEYEVLVKVKSAALNPVDYKCCDYEGGPFDFSFPRTVGIDHIGVVVKIGPKVDPNIYKVNETVLLAHGSLKSKYGAFGEYKVQDIRTAAIVPQDLIQQVGEQIYTDLATIPCAGYTALQIVMIKLRLPIYKDPNSISNRYIRNIVVTAGAGGVGYFTLQLLKLWKENNFDAEEQKNIRIISTCSKSNFDFVLSLGATHAIDYNSENVGQRVKEILGDNQLDVWIDLVDSKTTEEGLQTLGFRGELVVAVENTDYTNRLFGFSKSVHNVTLGLAYLYGSSTHKSDLKYYGEIFLDLYRNKKISIEKKVIKLEELKHYLIEMKNRHTRGKIVFQA